MRQLFKSFALAGLISASLGGAVLAQERAPANTPNRDRTTVADERSFPWGLLGLAGLAGLAGLMGQDRRRAQDRDVRGGQSYRATS